MSPRCDGHRPILRRAKGADMAGRQKCLRLTKEYLDWWAQSTPLHCGDIKQPSCDYKAMGARASNTSRNVRKGNAKGVMPTESPLYFRSGKLYFFSNSLKRGSPRKGKNWGSTLTKVSRHGLVQMTGL